MTNTIPTALRRLAGGFFTALALATAGSVLAQAPAANASAAPAADIPALAPLDPKNYSDPVRVACVGDSITAGSGAGPGQAYPAQLQRELGENWQVVNFGVSGRTLLRKGDRPYWNENAFKQAQAFQPDAVIILLGANDTKPQNWTNAAEFPTDYADLVNVFRGLESKPRIYVCRPTPTPAPGNFGINEAGVQEEIRVIDRLAREMKLGVIDMHAALEGKPELLPDRVHPNAQGAAEMAKAAARVLAGEHPSAAPLTRLNSLFRPHAVLQRGVALPVWGTASSGQAVTVEFAGQKVSTVAKDGKWQVKLKPLSASVTPQTLTVTGGNTLTVPDLLVGDVWVASGQSNMERQLGPRPRQKDLVGWKEAAAAADFPLIREYAVPKKFTAAPVDDARGRWTACTPVTAPDFTAVGFYFARALQPAVKVPVGIIHSSWGGTVAEAWTSAGSLKTMPAFREAVEKLSDAEAIQDKKQNTPTVLYNAMIAPLQQFPIKGAIWYQGESNNGRARQYRDLFPLMIADWRRGWGGAEFPFLFVQIAPHKDMTPELREAQFLTLKKSPRTAMAVLTDVGDAGDIHPARKEQVGVRLALAARALAYGQKVEYSGPLFDSMKIKSGKAVVFFKHIGDGLTAEGGELKGFTIAGADKKFVPAKAEIQGKTVVVWSDEIPKPAAVRYGWANVPDVNLCNKEGLPASPFRSDVD